MSDTKDLNRYYMILNNIYKIEVTFHAYSQALLRGIDPDLIENTIKCGKVVRFAKNRLKFVNKRDKNTIICIDEVLGEKIVIVTVAVK